MQFSTASEFEEWIKSDPKSPASSKPPSARTSASDNLPDQIDSDDDDCPTEVSVGAWTRPFGRALSSTLAAATRGLGNSSDRSSRASSRSPSEYSMCSADMDGLDSPRETWLDVTLQMEDSPEVVVIQAGNSDEVHTQIRESLSLPLECRMEVYFGSEMIKEGRTFKEWGICDMSELRLSFPPETVNGTIQGSGSLGLSIGENVTGGVCQGVVLEKVQGVAKKAGFKAGDVLVMANSIDVRKHSLEEVQDLFLKVKAEQERDGDNWKGLILTTQRHKLASKAKAMMMIAACKGETRH